MPWDAVFTTLDRSTVIATRYDAPSGGDFAVSFFLHHFDPTRRFQTPWGSVLLSTPHEQRPEHLMNRVYSEPGSG